MNSATIRIVGPKENRIVWSSERLLGASALMTTFFSVSSWESWVSSAKVGTSVSKLVALSPLYLTSFLNSPWIVSPLEEISLTLLSRTCVRKVGLWDADALLGRGEDRHDQPVQDEQRDQDDQEATAAEGDHRLLLRGPVRARVARVGAARRAGRGRSWRRASSAIP